MKKSIHVDVLADAGIPRVFWRVTKKQLNFPEVVDAILKDPAENILLSHTDLEHDCLGIMSVAAKILLADGRMVVMRGEHHVMDAYAKTYSGDVEDWNSLLSKDVLFLDSMDGLNVRRNMQQAPFHLIEDRFRSGRKTVVCTSLPNDEIVELYGSKMLKYFNNYYRSLII